ncbi:MAG: hypothetical protein JSW54_10025, partial [Fidelibacterota bacterium]
LGKRQLKATKTVYQRICPRDIARCIVDSRYIGEPVPFFKWAIVDGGVGACYRSVCLDDNRREDVRIYCKVKLKTGYGKTLGINFYIKGNRVFEADEG